LSKECPFWGIILAGESKRFRESRGVHKALYPLEGKPIIEKIYKAILPLTKGTYIVTPLPEIFSHLEIPLIVDKGEGEGPLRGVYTALRRFPRIFLLGCDMPFPSIPLLLYMKSIFFNKGYDIVACRTRGILQPFFAFYSDTLLPLIEENLKKKDYSLLSLFESCSPFVVEEREAERFDPTLSSFLNFNV